MTTLSIQVPNALASMTGGGVISFDTLMDAVAIYNHTSADRRTAQPGSHGINYDELLSYLHQLHEQDTREVHR